MFDVNRVTLVGRLGAKPELKTNDEGTLWAWLRVATSSSKDGEPVWHSVTAFDSNAENSARFLEKGSRVYIEGRIVQYRRSEDEFPVNTITAKRIIFLGPKSTTPEMKEAG